MNRLNTSRHDDTDDNDDSNVLVHSVHLEGPMRQSANYPTTGQILADNELPDLNASVLNGRMIDSPQAEQMQISDTFNSLPTDTLPLTENVGVHTFNEASHHDQDFTEALTVNCPGSTLPMNESVENNDYVDDEYVCDMLNNPQSETLTISDNAENYLLENWNNFDGVQ